MHSRNDRKRFSPLAVRAGTIAAVATLVAAIPLAAQARPQGQNQNRPRQIVKIDPARAESLYVSNVHEDHPVADFDAQIRNKARTDSIYAARTKGVMDYRKIKYRSSVGDMDIPAYLFAPLNKRGARGHAAMIWVHGGVHGDWSAGPWPFVKEAVDRGYVIIAPDYRGSTGYGKEHYNAIDYGGYELDDVASAADYLKTLQYVDPDRIGIMGWSHGGYITSHLVMREHTPFKAGAAIVPVTNLVFRLSYKGPYYQRQFATQTRIGGLPFEKNEEYIKRSPLYQVDKLQIPLLVHVATNDEDVNFVEDQQMVDALRSRKRDLAETMIYVDPPGGHGYQMQVDRQTLEPRWSPQMRDSWNRTWQFLEWNLRPYEDRSKPAATP
jgi:dipeptidyl aminopeptidase/acylaminoacyl peptidase